MAFTLSIVPRFHITDVLLHHPFNMVGRLGDKM